MYKYFKRIMDFVASLTALIILSPLMALSAVLVKISDGGSVLFKQRRPGKDGKIFTVYKFRTMSEKTEDENGRELSDVERMTKIGSFLRKTSLDELPQLFNILKGDLSIVGPRPIMEVETKIYGKYKDMLLSVKPGLTGFWAANGRSDTSYKRRRAMEIYYVKNRSLLFDIKIIFKTVISVFKGEGAK